MNKFTTTRSTNPLNPVYTLPKTELLHKEPDVKFVRDSLQIYVNDELCRIFKERLLRRPLR